MATSTFRRHLEQAYREHATGPALAGRVAEILQAHGIPARRDWLRSRLLPVLEACRERSLGDPALAALLACEWFERDLGLELVRRGLLEGDARALARLCPPVPAAVDSSRTP